MQELKSKCLAMCNNRGYPLLTELAPPPLHVIGIKRSTTAERKAPLKFWGVWSAESAWDALCRPLLTPPLTHPSQLD